EATLSRWAIEALSLSAWIEGDAGNLAEARDLHEEAITFCAPHYDKLRIEIIAFHLMSFMVILERWEEAARFDGFHLANLSRPEPEIYDTHHEPARSAYMAALGDRAKQLIDEGKETTGQQLHDYALGVLAEVRTQLTDT
ncbi:MAG: hypothetical protein V3U50_05395, partial [Acidimicrobiia bacterium]